jgi:hypothetical protein
MQTIMKAADDAALLSLMPHLIGMQPRNSVVLLGFLGNRTHGSLRFNLPVETGASAFLVYKRVSKTLVGTLSKMPGADGVVVAVVTDETFGPSPVPPHLDFVAELTRGINRSRFVLKAVLCRASDGWAPYFDPNVPVGGYPLADIVNADIASQLPPDLPELFDAATAPSRVPDAVDEVRNRVMADLRLIQDGTPTGRLDGGSRSRSDEPIDLIEFTENALTLSDDEFIRLAGEYLFILQMGKTSDPMMLQWASDPETTARLWAEVAQFEDDCVPIDSEFADVLNGVGQRPDPDRLERAIRFVLRLVACADDSARLRPLTVLAWLYWALGRGSTAAVHLAEALTLAPQDERVRELSSLVCAGVLPPWLFESDDADEGYDNYWDDDDWLNDDDDPDDGWLNDDDDWPDHHRNPF